MSPANDDTQVESKGIEGSLVTASTSKGKKPFVTSEVSTSILPKFQSANRTPQRRRAQNRAAQRAFRERKEQNARELEEKLSSLEGRYGQLEETNAKLRDAYAKLKTVLDILVTGDKNIYAGPRLVDVVERGNDLEAYEENEHNLQWENAVRGRKDEVVED
jgi:hypothetical protein